MNIFSSIKGGHKTKLFSSFFSFSNSISDFFLINSFLLFFCVFFFLKNGERGDQPCIDAGWLPSKKRSQRTCCGERRYIRIEGPGRHRPFHRHCGTGAADRKPHPRPILFRSCWTRRSRRRHS